MNDNKKRQVNWVFYAIIVLLIVFLIFISVKSPSGKKIEYSDFQDKVVAGEVTHIKTVGNTIYIRIKDSKITEVNFLKGKQGDYYTTFINSEKLISFIDDYNNGRLEGQTTPPEVKVVASYNLQGESIISKLLPYLSIGAVLIVTIL